MTGGAGNDRLDGGAGDANIAVFTGNQSDYTLLGAMIGMVAAIRIYRYESLIT